LPPLHAHFDTENLRCSAPCAASIRVHEQAETEGWHISFNDFLKVGFPVMLISVAVTNVYLWILNALFWQSSAGS
jgi:hypothetical protein